MATILCTGADGTGSDDSWTNITNANAIDGAVAVQSIAEDGGIVAVMTFTCNLSSVSALTDIALNIAHKGDGVQVELQTIKFANAGLATVLQYSGVGAEGHGAIPGTLTTVPFALTGPDDPYVLDLATVQSVRTVQLTYINNEASPHDVELDGATITYTEAGSRTSKLNLSLLSESRLSTSRLSTDRLS